MQQYRQHEGRDDAGQWNLEDKEARHGEQVKLKLSVMEDGAQDHQVVEVGFPYFGGIATEHFKANELKGNSSDVLVRTGLRPIAAWVNSTPEPKAKGARKKAGDKKEKKGLPAVPTTIVAAGMHALYLLYSSAVFAGLTAASWRRSTRWAPSAPTQQRSRASDCHPERAPA